MNIRDLFFFLTVKVNFHSLGGFFLKNQISSGGLQAVRVKVHVNIGMTDRSFSSCYKMHSVGVLNSGEAQFQGVGVGSS